MNLQLSVNEKGKYLRIMREIGKTRNVLKTRLLAVCSNAPDDQYQRINNTWFKLFDEHYEVFIKLIKDNNISSAFVLGRTLLELYTRSFYMEFIEKPNQIDVNLYLGQSYKIKSFAEMCQKLDSYESEDYGTFKHHFSQYKKTGLATYEKFSYFSHGRGYVIQQFFKNPKLNFSYITIAEALNIMHSMYLVLSMLFLFVQKQPENISLINDHFERFIEMMVELGVVPTESL